MTKPTEDELAKPPWGTMEESVQRLEASRRTAGSTLQAELNSLRGTDPLLDRLLERGPVTRESYLAYNFPDGVPDPMPAELKAQLPAPLQLSSLESATPSTRSAEEPDFSATDVKMAKAFGFL